MDAGKKSWLTGCGCGCGCAIPTFVTVYGLGVLVAYLIYEGGNRSDLFEPPLALVWPGLLGLIAAGLLGLITVFVARSVARKRMEGKQEDQAGPPPQAPPPQAPPPQQYPPQQFPPQQGY
jgi:hypothetical protein